MANTRRNRQGGLTSREVRLLSRFARCLTDCGNTSAHGHDLSNLCAAPSNATYLVTTAQGGLSAEIVVGATPGGQLGGTWACPTVDAFHSGSAHHTKYLDSEALAAAEAEATFDHGGSVTLASFLQYTEIASPCAGAANTARVFAVVNACCKTELRVIFQSGASQVIATEP